MESPCHRGTELVAGSASDLQCKACGKQYSEDDAAAQIQAQAEALARRQDIPNPNKG